MLNPPFKVVKTAVLSALALTACGNKMDANEKNFGAAISQYLEKKGDLCTVASKWPVEVTPWSRESQKTENAIYKSEATRMDALESIGFVKGVEVEKDDVYKKIKVTHYSLTDAAKPYAVEQKNFSGEKKIALCWGKEAVNKIVKWKGPMKFGDHQSASVVYTYKIDKAASWASDPKVQAAFPFIKQTMDGVGKIEKNHGVTLTNIGWEANDL